MAMFNEYGKLQDAEAEELARKIENLTDDFIRKALAKGSLFVEIRALGSWLHGSIGSVVSDNILRYSLELHRKKRLEEQE